MRPAFLYDHCCLRNSMSATGLITEKTHRSYLICPFQGVRWALSAAGMSPKTRRYVGFVFFFSSTESQWVFWRGFQSVVCTIKHFHILHHSIEYISKYKYLTFELKSLRVSEKVLAIISFINDNTEVVGDLKHHHAEHVYHVHLLISSYFQAD